VDSTALVSPTIWQMASWTPQVTLKTKRVHGSDDTTVVINQQIPRGPGGGRWWITTEKIRLSPKLFTHTDHVNRAFTGKRGRAIACVDMRTQTTYAAIRYHIDPDSDVGIKLLDISLPTDEDKHDVAYGATRLLKKYLHRISRDLGYGGKVGYAPNNDAERGNATGRLGFRRVRAPERNSSSKPYYEQPDV